MGDVLRGAVKPYAQILNSLGLKRVMYYRDKSMAEPHIVLALSKADLDFLGRLFNRLRA